MRIALHCLAEQSEPSGPSHCAAGRSRHDMVRPALAAPYKNPANSTSSSLSLTALLAQLSSRRPRPGMLSQLALSRSSTSQRVPSPSPTLTPTAMRSPWTHRTSSRSSFPLSPTIATLPPFSS
ncbi:hypothetical protein DAEQUDRAFT_759109 [Daedalea quercina L-15889]|uniref:Uncharacterized protein n=1 Tax=Daedalea quercina L-15889 TaxID=1314783 RepID=A0A165MKJ1_9APHY|nr:hypothetical protein DAEQUDRAFT_759109 [Daedalea quercina L-15889]